MLVQIVSLILTLVFVMAGSAKLTPLLAGDEVYADLEKNFKIFAQLFEISRFNITADQFRNGLGAVEVVLAVLLWITPRLSSFLLSCIMAGAIYAHLAVEDPVEKAVVPAVLLLLNLVVFSFSAPAKASKKKTT